MSRRVSDACPHYPKGVPDGHKCDAKLVLVGEAPGKYEDIAGYPFVGPAGYRLKEYLTYAGLSRNQFYITNVVDQRPPNNDIDTVSPAILQRYTDELHRRLGDRLLDPVLVVPTGNTAFTAVTGIRKKHKKDALITKWRGSILAGTIGGNRVKVIGTIHPASALRERVLDKTNRIDWVRIAREAKLGREIKVPQRRLIVQPHRHVIRELIQYARENPQLPISFDIETDPSQGQIICISFALDTMLGYSITYSDHMDLIGEMLSLPNPKVGQNFLYDAYWLAQEGITCANLLYDTGAMFHALDPNAGPQSASKDLEDPNAGRSRIKPYSLAYMTSIFTDEPYYKDEGRDEEGRFMRVNGDMTKLQRLQEYNAKDACVTFEIAGVLGDRLTSANKRQFYRDHYAAMFEPFLDAMLHGIRIDIPKAEELSKVYAGKMVEAKQIVASISGVPLEAVKVYKRQPKDYTPDNPAFVSDGVAMSIYGTHWVRLVGKSLSSQKVQQFLYDVLKLPERKKKGVRTADEAALQDLRLAYPEQCGTVVDAILQFRKYEKLAGYLKKGKVDADGRVRCQYKNLVQTGRCSSTKNPKDSGMNLQNIEPEVRSAFIPDEVEV